MREGERDVSLHGIKFKSDQNSSILKTIWPVDVNRLVQQANIATCLKKLNQIKGTGLGSS